MDELIKQLRKLHQEIKTAEEWEQIDAIEKRLLSIISQWEPTSQDVEKWNNPTNAEKWNDAESLDVSPCSTDCARYAAGTCPYHPSEKESLCPRWRDVLRPLDE